MIYPSFVDEIYSFNQQAGLLDAGYDDFLESSFQIEEALEGFDLFDLVNTMRSDYNGETTPKEYSRLIVGACALPGTGDFLAPTPIPDVDRLDKHIDSIIFSIGSIAKLGLTPQQIATAISIVTSANLQKLSMPKDEFGKLTKPSSFIGPEAQLQALLDTRHVS